MLWAGVSRSRAEGPRSGRNTPIYDLREGSKVVNGVPSGEAFNRSAEASDGQIPGTVAGGSGAGAQEPGRAGSLAPSDGSPPGSQTASQAVAEPQVVLKLDNVAKVFCGDVIVSSRYALLDIIGLGRLIWLRDKLRPLEFHALRDVGLEVYKGETLGVMGLPRSGKTTLLGIMGGLHRPDAGTLRRSVRPLYVGRATAGFRPMMTVEENAEFRAAMLGAIHAEHREIKERALDLAGLGEKRSVKLHNLDPLSTKRLGLAVPLCMDRSLYIFDDIFGGWKEPGFREKVRCRMDELTKNPEVTIVLASKDRKLIAEFADRVLVLSGGGIEVIAEPEDAFEILDLLAANQAQGDDLLPETGQAATGSLFGAARVGEEEDAEEGEQSIREMAIEEDSEQESAPPIQADTVPIPAASPPPTERRIPEDYVRAIWVNGDKYDLRQFYLLLKPGEAVTVKIEIVLAPLQPANQGTGASGEQVRDTLSDDATVPDRDARDSQQEGGALRSESLVLALHAPFQVEPIAAREISLPPVPSQANPAVRVYKTLYEIAFDFVVPDLQSNFYGMTLFRPRKPGVYRRKHMHKILIFRVITSAEPGVHFRPQLDQVNCKAIPLPEISEHQWFETEGSGRFILQRSPTMKTVPGINLSLKGG